jgi:CHAT domain-containing protein/tetratricopeptide (TPR) repeat protein
VERALSGGQSHAYRVAVAGSQLLEASVTEKGIHVALSLDSGGGTERLATAGRIRAVSEAGESYRLVVRPLRSDAPRGGYVLEVAARPASDTDRLRFAAELRLAEAERLLAQQTETAMRRAEGDLREVEKLAVRAGDDAVRCRAVNLIGLAHERLGDMRAAVGFRERALELARQAAEAGVEVDALIGLGIARGHLGEMASATESLRSAVERARASRDRHREGKALLALANVIALRDQGDEVILTLEEAQPLLEEFGDVGGLSSVENALGGVYARLGNGERARAHAEQALLMRRRLGLRLMIAVSLSNLAHVLTHELDRPAEALPLLAECLEIVRGAGNRRAEAAALAVLGAARSKLGRLEEGLADYERSLAIAREVGDPRGAADALVRIGELRQRLGLLEGARQAFDEALRLARRAEVVGSELDARLGLARLASAAGDASRARREAEELVGVVESARAAVARSELRADFFATVRAAYDLYVEQLIAAGDVPGAFQASERSRARTLLDALTAADPSAPPVGVSPPADVAQVQKQLDTETTLVEYALGGSRSFAWVITAGELRVVPLEARHGLEASARRFVELLTTRNAAAAGASLRGRVAQADAELPAAARDLSDRILRPLELPDLSRLVVVADGALQYVPFAALPAPGSDEPLVARRQVVVLPSASVLEALRAAPRKNRTAPTVAVLADPVFRSDDPRVTGVARPGRRGLAEQVFLRSAEESGLAGLPRLRFSRAEAQAVAGLAPDRARLFLDFAAARDALAATEVRSARILHFATHGLLNSRNPELTGLVLSMVDRGGVFRDGFVRLPELHRLRLDADLVVLSACQTALGKDVRGEGLVGLTRAFMVAGAPRVVASLWRVHDQATAELMKRFYAALLGRGLSPAAALGEAQRSMAADPRWRAPYYWAAFTFNGDWD